MAVTVHVQAGSEGDAQYWRDKLRTIGLIARAEPKVPAWREGRWAFIAEPDGDPEQESNERP